MKIDLSKLKTEMPYTYKVQSTKGRAVCVAYVDARQVAEKLDEVVGPGNWEERYERDSAGHLFCYLTIWVDGKPITKADVGAPSDFEKIKGEASDAFKRAAVKWGVGRFLYDLPEVILKTAEYKGKKYPSPDGVNILWNKKDLNKYIFDEKKDKQKPPAKAKPVNTKALTVAEIRKIVKAAKTVEVLEQAFKALPQDQKGKENIIKIFKDRKRVMNTQKILSK